MLLDSSDKLLEQGVVGQRYEANFDGSSWTAKVCRMFSDGRTPEEEVFSPRSKLREALYDLERALLEDASVDLPRP